MTKEAFRSLIAAGRESESLEVKPGGLRSLIRLDRRQTMNRTRRRWFALVTAGVVICLTPRVALGQIETPIYPVAVEHSGTDPVGTQLARSVTSELRRSKQLAFTPRLTESALVLELISLSDDADSEASSIAVVLRLNNGEMQTLIKAQLLRLGRARVQERAERLVVEMEEELERSRRGALLREANRLLRRFDQDPDLIQIPAPFDESKLPFDPNAGDANRYFANLAKQVYDLQAAFTALVRRVQALERKQN